MAERPRLSLPEAPNRALDRWLAPFAVFGQHKLAGAGVLMTAAALGITWALSPAYEHYFALLSTPMGVVVSGFELIKPLSLWINDAVMGAFFFLVGLEIKREVIAGELSTLRKAALPGIAAVGGMLVPALLFWWVVGDSPSRSGWGVPMATDIAFALGVLALLGDRVSPGLKVFLTALAIVDDIGAVLVIAIFYTEQVALPSLAVGAGAFAVALLLGRLGVRSAAVYFALGIVAWLGFLKSGVHATIAALLMAFAIPAGTRVTRGDFLAMLRRGAEKLERTPVSASRVLTGEEQAVSEAVARMASHASSPLLTLEHALLPIVTFAVLPVFALSNAGVRVEGSVMESLSSPLALGIVAGLCVGKQLGVFGFTWLAVRAGVTDLPEGVTLRHVYGVSLLSGIGFTMALFIAGLAFDDAATLDTAKVAILVGSVISAVAGYGALRLAGRV